VTDDELVLRDVSEPDLAVFFDYQRDPDAVRMAAFTAADPDDRAAFDARWRRMLANDTATVKTIVVGDEVVGSVLCWLDEKLGVPEVSYWIGREHWDKGFATRALAQFLENVVTTRPLLGRAAKDNVGSLRVLEKCGFRALRTERSFANARGEEIEEVVLELR
jgi:RimJ/RimL family protein N-acetyltransferase